MNQLGSAATPIQASMLSDDVDICDELAQFDERQKTLLVSRSHVYVTDGVIGEGRHGTVIAQNCEEARDIARGCRHGEKVLGLMAHGFLQRFRGRVQRWRCV